MLEAMVAAPFGNLPLWQCAHDKLLTSNLTIRNNAREARARKTIITGSQADFNNSVRRAAPEARPVGLHGARLSLGARRCARSASARRASPGLRAYRSRPARGAAGQAAVPASSHPARG